MARSSPYASYFDIDWHPLKRELENKVLLPILGDQYGRVLEKGELRLVFADGVFTVRYFGSVLPIEAFKYASSFMQGALEQIARRGGGGRGPRIGKHHHRGGAPSALHGLPPGENP